MCVGRFRVFVCYLWDHNRACIIFVGDVAINSALVKKHDDSWSPYSTSTSITGAAVIVVVRDIISKIIDFGVGDGVNVVVEVIVTVRIIVVIEIVIVLVFVEGLIWSSFHQQIGVLNQRLLLVLGELFQASNGDVGDRKHGT